MKFPTRNTGRRRRTNPDNKSSATSSYKYRSRRRDQERPKNPEEVQRRRNFKVSLFGYLVATYIVAMFGYVLYLSPDSRVQIIQVDGGAQKSVEDYQANIKQTINSSVLNRTKITIDTSSIRDQILSQNPELADVQVSLPLLGTKVVVNLVPETPRIIVANNSGLFLVANDGRVMSEVGSVNISGNTGNIQVVSDESGLLPKPGEYVLSTRDIQAISTLSEGLASIGTNIESVTLPAVANQVDIKPKGVGYYLKFSLLEDPLTGVGAYKAFMKEIQSLQDRPSEYIDLRITEKIFYK